MKKNQKNVENNALIFNKINYIILIISILIVFLGFILMAGDTNIYSTTKITIAPVIVLVGFGLGVYSILKSPKKK